MLMVINKGLKQRTSQVTIVPATLNKSFLVKQKNLIPDRAHTVSVTSSRNRLDWSQIKAFNWKGSRNEDNLLHCTTTPLEHSGRVKGASSIAHLSRLIRDTLLMSVQSSISRCTKSKRNAPGIAFHWCFVKKSFVMLWIRKSQIGTYFNVFMSCKQMKYKLFEKETMVMGDMTLSTYSINSHTCLYVARCSSQNFFVTRFPENFSKKSQYCRKTPLKPIATIMMNKSTQNHMKVFTRFANFPKNAFHGAQDVESKKTGKCSIKNDFTLSLMSMGHLQVQTTVAIKPKPCSVKERHVTTGANILIRLPMLLLPLVCCIGGRFDSTLRQCRMVAGHLRAIKIIIIMMYVTEV